MFSGRKAKHACLHFKGTCRRSSNIPSDEFIMGRIGNRMGLRSTPLQVNKQWSGFLGQETGFYKRETALG